MQLAKMSTVLSDQSYELTADGCCSGAVRKNGGSIVRKAHAVTGPCDRGARFAPTIVMRRAGGSDTEEERGVVIGYMESH